MPTTGSGDSEAAEGRCVVVSSSLEVQYSTSPRRSAWNYSIRAIDADTGEVIWDTVRESGWPVSSHF